ncbi:MAG: hypothetical protein AB7T06_24585 [Kofleriaceae bacterium]
MKWLAVAAVVIIAAVLLLWRQMSTDTEVIPTATAAKAHAAEMPTTPTERAREERVKAAAKLAEEVKAAEAKADPNAPEKVDAMSDEFFYKLPERVPKMLGKAAAKCYEGIARRVHRNENVVFDFKTKVKDGVVTISDVKVNRSSISQPALQTCFAQEIGRVTWKDDTLPDWEGDDQLTISPERGLKKFMQDNIDYVGEPVRDGYDVKPHKADTEERGGYEPSPSE